MPRRVIGRTSPWHKGALSYVRAVGLPQESADAVRGDVAYPKCGSGFVAGSAKITKVLLTVTWAMRYAPLRAVALNANVWSCL